LRNKLSKLNFEGLILTGQEFGRQNGLTVTKAMVELYQNIAKEFYQKKKVLKGGKLIKEVSVPDQTFISEIIQEKELDFEQIQPMTKPDIIDYQEVFSDGISKKN